MGYPKQVLSLTSGSLQLLLSLNTVSISNLGMFTILPSRYITSLPLWLLDVLLGTLEHNLFSGGSFQSQSSGMIVSNTSVP
uniref:Uncharacterized protein n=1 Tax=Arcella intermedia TaxID=1963864 RepID=A0A6B2LUC4_9EUKA